MRRWLYTQRYVSGNIPQLQEALQRQADALVRRSAETGEVIGDLSGISHVRLSVDPATRLGDRLKVPLRWELALGQLANVVLEAELEFELLADDLAQLVLAGTYAVPGPATSTPDGPSPLRNAVEGAATRLINHLTGELPEATTTAAPEQLAPGPATLRVRDVMTPNPVVLAEEMPVRVAALLLVRYRVTGAAVVDDRDELVGVLSETDLVAKEAVARWDLGPRTRDDARRRHARTVRQACSRPAKVISPDRPLHEAARTLLDEDVGRLVVVDDTGVVGIFARHDLLKVLTRRDNELSAAVYGVLEQEDVLQQVQVHIEWGEVTLTGSTRLRGTALRLGTRVGDINGVIAVDNRVAWETEEGMDTRGFTGSVSEDRRRRGNRMK